MSHSSFYQDIHLAQISRARTTLIDLLITGSQLDNLQISSYVDIEKYRSILRKLGDSSEPHFKKNELVAKLIPEENRVFDNFLRKMRELGVIISDQESDRGTYKFVNDIYPVYILMESLEHRSKAK